MSRRRARSTRAAVAAFLMLSLACAPTGDPGERDSVESGADGSVGTPAPSPASTTPGTDAQPRPSGAAQGAWRVGAEAPMALTEVAAAPFVGGVWTAGGVDADGEPVAAVHIYDPTFDAWSEGPALPTAVHHGALVSAGDRLYLVGGYTGAALDTPVEDVFILDAATGTWETAPPLPEPRAAGAGAWDGQRLIYGGGVGPHGVVDDVWALDGGGWSPLAALSEPREHLAAASDGAGKVWFLGGRRGGLDSNLAVVDLLEEGDVSAVGALPTPRGGVAGFFAGPDIGACAAGGEAPDGTFAQVECVDAHGEVTRLPDLSVARHGLGAAAVEGSALVLLGGREPGLSTSAVVELLSLAPDGA